MASIGSAVQVAQQIGPAVIEGVQHAADLIVKHTNRIEPMRVIDKKIAEEKEEIARLKKWYRDNDVDLPKSGSGIMDVIRDGIDRLSETWAQGKMENKAKEFAELEAYRIVLAETKRKIQAMPKSGSGAARHYKLKVKKLDGGSAVMLEVPVHHMIEADVEGGMAMHGGMHFGRMPMRHSTSTMHGGRVRPEQSRVYGKSESMLAKKFGNIDGARSNPDYMQNIF